LVRHAKQFPPLHKVIIAQQCALPTAVLLREHTKKAVSRSEIKDQVMPEHKSQDRSGKIFKQVLSVANEKLHAIAGLEIVLAGEGDGVEDDGDVGGGASQAALSQSQTAASSQASRATAGAQYFLVSQLPDPVTVPLDEAAPATSLYLAFVEVVLILIQQSEGFIAEDDLFGCLQKMGLDRESKLPLPAEQEKVESLVQKRLVHEAYLRRRKKANEADKFEYVAGPRAVLNRNDQQASDFFKMVMAER
jgi:hypothetical protein